MGMVNVQEIRIPEHVHILQYPDFIEDVVNIRCNFIIAINMTKMFNILFK
ncbi:hypothetical protein [uncultured Methanolobus sp.]|nr:hypothetical protein [uncultured Methanolobus sp.]